MEFFPVDSSEPADAATLQKLFDGDTLVLCWLFFPHAQPSVSFANLGQLTLDLVINTLLHKGDASDASLVKVGHLFSTAVPPIAGPAAFGAQNGNALCVNLEVYRIPSRRVTLIQQRTDITKGKARAFAAELVHWATASGFSMLVVIAGADDMLRHDHNMQRRPLQTIVSSATTTEDKDALSHLRNGSFLAATNASFAWDKDLRGVGIAPLLHSQCESSCQPPLDIVSFVLSCAEGDNVPDAISAATHLLKFLDVELVTPSGAPPQFVFPPSWNQLFGRGPDASLF